MHNYSTSSKDISCYFPDLNKNPPVKPKSLPPMTHSCWNYLVSSVHIIFVCSYSISMHMCMFVWCLHRYICAMCVCICTGVYCIHAHACVHAHLHMPSHVKAGDECWFSFSTAFHLFGSVFLNVSLKLKLTSFARLACQRAHRIGLSQPFCAGVINTQHQKSQKH